MKTKLILFLCLWAGMTNAQMNWNLCNTGLPDPSHYIFDIEVADNGNVYILLDSISGDYTSIQHSITLAKSIDGGSTWTTQSINGLPATYRPQDLILVGNQLIIGGIDDINLSDGSYYSSTDGGQNWIKNNIGLSGYTFTLKFDTAPNGNLYCLSQNMLSAGNILTYSTDNGNTWKIDTINRIDSIGNIAYIFRMTFAGNKMFLFANTYSLISDYEYFVYASSDGGVNWTLITNGLDSLSSFYDIYEAPNGDLYLAGRAINNIHDPKIWKSDDAGISWSNVSVNGINDTIVDLCRINGYGNQLYVSCFKNIFSSTISTGGMSVQKTVEPETFTLYPNPAEDQVHFQIPDDQNTTFQLQIINQLGHVCVQKELPAGQRQTDVSELESGCYLIYLWNEDQFYVSKLIRH